jgi:ferric-dicitrate binding protein FerR (iron transport regulator)
MSENLEHLYKGYLANTLSPEELNEFLVALHDPENERQVSQWMDGTWKEMFQLKPMIRHHGVSRSEPRVILIWKWIAAACILLVMGYALWVTSKGKHQPDYANAPQQQRYKNDIAPAGQGVVLTLADGRQIVLDSTKGNIANEGGVAVINKDGSVSYAPVTHNPQPVTVFNTVSTQKGRTYHLQLSDGTQVWLNSQSSLKYPTAFNGPTREVEITGEAYFEVKHNAKQPFKVHLPNGSVVEDIGTSFNINSYKDESDIKATLIEGSIAVSLSGVEGKANRKILKPGEQAIVHASKADGRILPDVLSMTNNPIRVQNDVDLEETLAWKNGRFQFNGSSVEDIMNQLKRWYDIDVEYKDKITETFVAKISRDLPVSKLLALLEMTKQVKFVVDGNKIIVMKY